MVQEDSHFLRYGSLKMNCRQKNNTHYYTSMYSSTQSTQILIQALEHI